MDGIEKLKENFCYPIDQQWKTFCACRHQCLYYRTLAEISNERWISAARDFQRLLVSRNCRFRIVLVEDFAEVVISS